jgi:hypothetical protein
MINLYEFQTASEVLTLLEFVQSPEDARKFADTYIKSVNSRLTHEGYDPLETKEILRFIAMVDSRFTQ